MKKVLRIIGAGGHGKVVADVATACGYDDIAFLDEGWPEKRLNGRWQIVGVPQDRLDGARFCAVGDNTTRASLFQTCGLQNSPKLIHPNATLSPSARLGAGSLMVAGSIANADAQIGQGVILNTGCSVDHDCVLEGFVHISPGARLAGGVTVGARAWIGIGAVVREGVHIGADAVIGAGAVVTQDVTAGTCVVGVPAKRIR